MNADTWTVQPGYGLGFMSTTTDTNGEYTVDTVIALGAALQDIVTTIEQEKDRFPNIDIHFSHSDPLTAPILVSLPENGLRLRFDGADQRLRLIEVTDFKRISLTYKGAELVRSQDATTGSQAPAFKRVYQLFGASYPGEYMAPQNGGGSGTYVLSWPGIAFNFPLQNSAWSPEKDHVSLLGSSAAASAAHMAIFEGKTWADTRKDLFVREPNGPRSTAIVLRPRDSLPAELEYATVHADGRVEVARRLPSQPFILVPGQTTPQDLVTELGAPDAKFKPIDKEPSVEKALPTSHTRTSSSTRRTSNGRMQPMSQPSSYSSTNTDTFDADFDNSSDHSDDPAERRARDTYWCYFSHGLDILVGPPSSSTSASEDLVVKRVVIQGNVPGSAAFNRHRRLRWVLNLSSQDLTSESNFEYEIKPVLLELFPEAAKDPQTAQGRVINRCWDDPMESTYFLPDQDRDAEEGGKGSEAWLGNVRLFQFFREDGSGLMFEVLQNGCVAGVFVVGE